MSFGLSMPFCELPFGGFLCEFGQLDVRPWLYIRGRCSYLNKNSPPWLISICVEFRAKNWPEPSLHHPTPNPESLLQLHGFTFPSLPSKDLRLSTDTHGKTFGIARANFITFGRTWCLLRISPSFHSSAFSDNTAACKAAKYIAWLPEKCELCPAPRLSPFPTKRFWHCGAHGESSRSLPHPRLPAQRGVCAGSRGHIENVIQTHSLTDHTFGGFILNCRFPHDHKKKKKST